MRLQHLLLFASLAAANPPVRDSKGVRRDAVGPNDGNTIVITSTVYVSPVLRWLSNGCSTTRTVKKVSSTVEYLPAIVVSPLEISDSPVLSIVPIEDITPTDTEEGEGVFSTIRPPLIDSAPPSPVVTWRSSSSVSWITFTGIPDSSISRESSRLHLSSWEDSPITPPTISSSKHATTVLSDPPITEPIVSIQPVLTLTSPIFTSIKPSHDIDGSTFPTQDSTFESPTISLSRPTAAPVLVSTVTNGTTGGIIHTKTSLLSSNIIESSRSFLIPTPSSSSSALETSLPLTTDIPVRSTILLPSLPQYTLPPISTITEITTLSTRSSKSKYWTTLPRFPKSSSSLRHSDNKAGIMGSVALTLSNNISTSTSTLPSLSSSICTSTGYTPPIPALAATMHVPSDESVQVQATGISLGQVSTSTLILGHPTLSLMSISTNPIPPPVFVTIPSSSPDLGDSFTAALGPSTTSILDGTNGTDSDSGIGYHF
ncbi:hypothetical protein M501DRAFT_1057463 [Patellaria atrata CBS 101060]|uniref:Uncharacterized protein n=1 Tax=Patellaria atrata CBS 101060 TaxID=1346257 RepID=A0A9P4VRT1_9PEZI|nr:hypothetical protein M501DRAFT_1057463 [Patellaria atrata CBS 101060]